MTTTQPQAATIKPNFSTLWEPLDRITCAENEEDGTGPLARAIDAIEAVKTELSTGKPFNAGVLARLLGVALKDLHSVDKAEYDLIEALAELEGWGD